MSKKKHDKYKPTASYARGVLTVDLPGAKEPVLWRQEIKDVSRVSFALQTLASGDRALVLRVSDGAEQIIATFDNQTAAEQALAVLRDTLLNTQSGWDKIIKSIWRIVKWILIIAAIIFAVQFAISFYANYIAAQSIQQAVQQQQTETATAAKPPEGVPLVADDVLQAPAE